MTARNKAVAEEV